MLHQIIRKFRILTSQKKPFRFLLARLLVFSRLSNLLSFKRNGYRLRFFPSALSQELWIYPEDNLFDELFLSSLVQEGDTAIDIGANIGSITLALSRAVGSSGRIYSIEAHPVIFKFLRENVRLNKAENIEVWNCALGNFNGNIYFSDKKWDNENVVLKSWETGGRLVQLHRLDDLGINDHKIKLLKIDVEGYEKFVIEGASAILKRTDCVYFEYYKGNYERYGYQFSEIYFLLKEMGFTIYRMNQWKPEKLGPDYSSSICENLVAVRDSHILGKYL